MKFTRVVFWVAAVYGLAAILPLYFSEQTMSAQYPPPITHAEYYYSFAGVTLVWQILFIAIALNPARLRIVIPFCVAEKLSLLPTVLILAPEGRFPQLWIPALIIDLLLAALFLVAFMKIGKEARHAAIHAETTGA